MQDPHRKQRIPKKPKRPERICWGCDRLCAADKMLCGNGSERSQHPCELFGDDWYESLTEDELKYIEACLACCLYQWLDSRVTILHNQG